MSECHECQQRNLTVLQLHSLCWQAWLLGSGIGAELLGAALEPQPVQAAVQWAGESDVTPKQ